MKYVRQKVSFEFVIFQLHEVLSMRVEASHRRFFRFNYKRGFLVTLRHGDPADAGNTAPQFLLAAKCNKVSPSMLMIKILSMNLVLGKSVSTAATSPNPISFTIYHFVSYDFPFLNSRISC